VRPTDAGNRFERKRWLAWLIVAAIALVGAELVLRFTEWDIVKFAYDYRQVFRYHDRWYTDYEPATSTHIRLPADQGYILNFLVTVNQHGFRSTDLPVEHHDENRANIKYIHAIGDSFTMGWGVNYESSYPAQLDTQLSPEYDVLNLGLNGFGAIGATEKSLEVEQRFPPAYAIYLATANDYDDDHIATVYAQRPWLVHRLMDLINLLRRTTYMATVPFAVRWWIYYRDAQVASGQPDSTARCRALQRCYRQSVQAGDRGLRASPDRSKRPVPRRRPRKFGSGHRHRALLQGTGHPHVARPSTGSLESGWGGWPLQWLRQPTYRRFVNTLRNCCANRI